MNMYKKSFVCITLLCCAVAGIMHSAEQDVREQKREIVDKLRVGSMEELYRVTDFGRLLSKILLPVGGVEYDFGRQGKAQVYKATYHHDASSQHLVVPRGAYVYVDLVHGDHLEVFQFENGRARPYCVIDLDGKVLLKKTQAAIAEDRTLEVLSRRLLDIDNERAEQERERAQLEAEEKEAQAERAEQERERDEAVRNAQAVRAERALVVAEQALLQEEGQRNKKINMLRNLFDTKRNAVDNLPIEARAEIVFDSVVSPALLESWLTLWTGSLDRVPAKIQMEMQGVIDGEIADLRTILKNQKQSQIAQVNDIEQKSQALSSVGREWLRNLFFGICKSQGIVTEGELSDLWNRYQSTQNYSEAFLDNCMLESCVRTQVRLEVEKHASELVSILSDEQRKKKELLEQYRIDCANRRAERFAIIQQKRAEQKAAAQAEAERLAQKQQELAAMQMIAEAKVDNCVLNVNAAIQQLYDNALVSARDMLGEKSQGDVLAELELNLKGIIQSLGVRELFEAKFKALSEKNYSVASMRELDQAIQNKTKLLDERMNGLVAYLQQDKIACVSISREKAFTQMKALLAPQSVKKSLQYLRTKIRPNAFVTTLHAEIYFLVAVLRNLDSFNLALHINATKQSILLNAIASDISERIQQDVPRGTVEELQGEMRKLIDRRLPDAINSLRREDDESVQKVPVLLGVAQQVLEDASLLDLVSVLSAPKIKFYKKEMNVFLTQIRKALLESSQIIHKVLTARKSQ